MSQFGRLFVPDTSGGSSLGSPIVVSRSHPVTGIHGPPGPSIRRSEEWPLPDAFEAGPFRVQLGVRRISPSEWLDLDERYDEQVALKEELYLRPTTRVLVRSASAPDDAEIELFDLAADEVGRLAPDQRERIYRLSVTHGRGVHTAGLITQEDWVILGDPNPGLDQAAQLCVTSASVSFPTRWLLEEKLGLGVTEVHSPVHEYDAKLADRAVKFMGKITASTCWTRNNWNLVDEVDLHQPTARFRGPGPNPEVTASNAGHTLYLRVERETFRRLARTGALVFGIRVHVAPLESLKHQPERLRALRSAVAELPSEVAAYKGVPAFERAFLAWADTVLERG